MGQPFTCVLIKETTVPRRYAELTQILVLRGTLLGCRELPRAACFGIQLTPTVTLYKMPSLADYVNISLQLTF